MHSGTEEVSGGLGQELLGAEYLFYLRLVLADAVGEDLQREQRLPLQLRRQRGERLDDLLAVHLAQTRRATPASGAESPVGGCAASHSERVVNGVAIGGNGNPGSGMRPRDRSARSPPS